MATASFEIGSDWILIAGASSIIQVTGCAVRVRSELEGAPAPIPLADGLYLGSKEEHVSFNNGISYVSDYVPSSEPCRFDLLKGEVLWGRADTVAATAHVTVISVLPISTPPARRWFTRGS